MKYVIWGCGFRGKNIFNFIGAEKIEAFIDSSPELIGTKKCGIKVISFEEYLEEYSDCIIIISPFFGHDEIKTILDSHRLEFFSSRDFPPEVCVNPIDDLYDVIESKFAEEPILLYGFNIYSLVILEHFRNKGFDVKIIPSAEDSHSLMSIAEKNISECFANVNECIGLKVFVTNKKYLIDKELEKINSENLYDFIYDIPKYYNPKIEEYKNIHKGKRCFIVCTGPSLRVEDLDKLAENNDICLSMNGIFKIYDSTKWRPDYYCITDPKVFREYKSSIFQSENRINDMIIADGALDNDEYDGIKICHSSMHHVDYNAYPDFSLDVSKGVYVTGTVTYMCLQFAVYLGCTEIYLIGLDYNYDNKYNHFTKEYLPSEGTKLGYLSVRLKNVKLEYEVAKKTAEKLGIVIKNASRFTKLDVFEKVDFDSLF